MITTSPRATSGAPHARSLAGLQKFGMVQKEVERRGLETSP